MNSIQHIPKAEIHVHLEATIGPNLCRKFAKRNKLEINEDILNISAKFKTICNNQDSKISGQMKKIQQFFSRDLEELQKSFVEDLSKQKKDKIGSVEKQLVEKEKMLKEAETKLEITQKKTESKQEEIKEIEEIDEIEEIEEIKENPLRIQGNLGNHGNL